MPINPEEEKKKKEKRIKEHHKGVLAHMRLGGKKGAKGGKTPNVSSLAELPTQHQTNS